MGAEFVAPDEAGRWEQMMTLRIREQNVTVAAEKQEAVALGEPLSPPEPMGEEERALWTSEAETPDLPSQTSEPTAPDSPL